MALIRIINGQLSDAPQLDQVIDLLTGVMNDQPVSLANTLTTLKDRRVSVQSPAFAASFTPDVTAGEFIKIGALTGNITVNNPSTPLSGQQLTLQFTQDATGGRTVTWGSALKTGWQPPPAPNAVDSVSFIYDGTNWQDLTAMAVDQLGNFNLFNVFNVKFYGAKGDGSTDDTQAIERAVLACYTAGGGVVWIPPTPNGYVIKRRTVGDQSSGGIMLRKGVSLLGNFTKLLLRDNTDFITSRTPWAAFATITADVTLGDATVAVDNSGIFTVNQEVYLRCGNSGTGETAETSYFGFAKVSAIPDGTHLTLDRPFLTTMAVASTAAGNRQVMPLDEVVEGIFIEGFSLINDIANGGNAERGIRLRWTRNIRVENITAQDPGAGIISTQFTENLRAKNLRVTSCVKQGGSAKGRCIGFSESVNISVEELYGENFESNFIFTEFFCRNLRFSNVWCWNNSTVRVNSGNALFFVQNSDVQIENTVVWGNSSYMTDDGGVAGAWGLPAALRFRNLTVRMIGSVSAFYGIDAVEGLFRIEKNPPALVGDYSVTRVWSKVFPIPPSVTGKTLTMPTGLYRTLKVYVTSTTGLLSMFFKNGSSSNSNDVKGNLVAGQLSDIYLPSLGTAGINWNGNGWNSANLTRSFSVSTDGTVPANTYGVVEAEYWPVLGAGVFHPYPDDLSKGFIEDEASFAALSSLLLTGDIRHSRQAPAFVASFTPDPTLGEIISVGTLTTNISLNNVTSPVVGQAITLVFTQDATGGRTVTWGAAYKVNWLPSLAPNTKNTITFLYDGTNWIQQSYAAGLT